MKRKLFGLFLAAFLATIVLGQQPQTVEPEKIDTDMNAKIRKEGLERSKIMWIEHFLTDVYGPRPTGTPNHRLRQSGRLPR